MFWLYICSKQFIFLETCFYPYCSNQTLLLSYGTLVSAAILIVVRIWLFTHLLNVFKNFGYGLADTGMYFTKLFSLLTSLFDSLYWLGDGNKPPVTDTKLPTGLMTININENKFKSFTT